MCEKYRKLHINGSLCGLIWVQRNVSKRFDLNKGYQKIGFEQLGVESSESTHIIHNDVLLLLAKLTIFAFPCFHSNRSLSLSTVVFLFGRKARANTACIAVILNLPLRDVHFLHCSHRSDMYGIPGII